MDNVPFLPTIKKIQTLSPTFPDILVFSDTIQLPSSVGILKCIAASRPRHDGQRVLWTERCQESCTKKKPGLLCWI